MPLDPIRDRSRFRDFLTAVHGVKKTTAAAYITLVGTMLRRMGADNANDDQKFTAWLEQYARSTHPNRKTARNWYMRYLREYVTDDVELAHAAQQADTFTFEQPIPAEFRVWAKHTKHLSPSTVYQYESALVRMMRVSYTATGTFNDMAVIDRTLEELPGSFEGIYRRAAKLYATWLSTERLPGAIQLASSSAPPILARAIWALRHELEFPLKILRDATWADWETRTNDTPYLQNPSLIRTVGWSLRYGEDGHYAPWDLSWEQHYWIDRSLRNWAENTDDDQPLIPTRGGSGIAMPLAGLRRLVDWGEQLDPKIEKTIKPPRKLRVKPEKPADWKVPDNLSVDRGPVRPGTTYGLPGEGPPEAPAPKLVDLGAPPTYTTEQLTRGKPLDDYYSSEDRQSSGPEPSSGASSSSGTASDVTTS